MEQVGLDGRVAVVTGAGRGLGRAHALALAARGAAVVVNDLGVGLDGRVAATDAAAEVVAEIEAAGGTGVADGGSVATPEGGRSLVETAVGAFGRIDIIVNNAGFLRDATFAKLAPEDVKAVIDVHLAGAFWTVQPAWPHFKEQGYGRIINTSSVAGLLGNFGQANYSAAKMGLVGLTRTLAVEGARNGITANVISPAARTRMTEELLGDRKDRLDPSLVSPLVVWLASEGCTATGEIFSVGAGHVARVVISEGRGHTDAHLTPEALRDSWDAIMRADDLSEPRTVAEEFALMFADLT